MPQKHKRKSPLHNATFAGVASGMPLIQLEAIDKRRKDDGRTCGSDVYKKNCWKRPMLNYQSINFSLYPAILRACKQLNNEGQPLLYGNRLTVTLLDIEGAEQA